MPITDHPSLPIPFCISSIVFDRPSFIVEENAAPKNDFQRTGNHRDTNLDRSSE